METQPTKGQHKTMNTLQNFIQSLEPQFGFMDGKDLATLTKIDRLHPVLVRCGGCRFTCGAQYVEHLTRCIAAGGDYVRDYSLPVGSMERAVDWKPEPLPASPVIKLPVIKTANERATAGRTFDGEASYEFDENHCGGVFDGRGVVSDADPGL